MSTAKARIRVYTPEAAAEILATSVPQLIRLLKECGYAYHSKVPGAKPWGQGRQEWGLSDEHIDGILRGQGRTMPAPAARSEAAPKPLTTLPGHDGKDRIPAIQPKKKKANA